MFVKNHSWDFFLLTSDTSFSTSTDDLLLLSVFKEELYVFVILHGAFFPQVRGGTKNENFYVS